MIYNAHFFGGFLTSGYQVVDEIPPQGLFSVNYLLNALAEAWTRIGFLLPLIVVITIVFGLIGLWFLWRRNRAGALVIGLSLVFTIGLYSIYYYSWTGSLTRFMIPVYPFLALIAAGVIGWLAVRVKDAFIRSN